MFHKEMEVDFCFFIIFRFEYSEEITKIKT